MAEDIRVRDKWDKWEAISKIVGGVSIPVMGLVLTAVLQRQADSSQQAQLYASILTGREKADSEVRAQMFSHLLDRFLTQPNKRSVTLKDFQDRIMFLDLLRDNFQEYFNAKPLFTRLYEDIKEKEAQATSTDAKKQWSDLKQQLIDVALDMTSGQVASLGRAGNVVEDISVPLLAANSVQPEKDSKPPESKTTPRIALYPTQGLSGLREGGLFDATEGQPKAAGLTTGEKSGRGDHYSISIEVKKIDESSANLSVVLHRDYYSGGRFDPERSRDALGVKPIEFNVSYFSTPYMDNTRLFDGSRFSVLYKGCFDYEEADRMCRFPLKKGRRPSAQLDIVTFDEGFLSQRDRPYVDQILTQIGKKDRWWPPF